MTVYDLRSIELPRLAGKPLAALVKAIESPLVGTALCAKMLADTGFVAFRKTSTRAAPATHALLPPCDDVENRDDPALDMTSLALGENTENSETAFTAPSIADYARAFAENKTSPVEVAEAFIEAVAQSEANDPKLSLFISQSADDVRAQAAASWARHQAGRPLSVLDGVPVGVKDEVDQKGYETSVGTSFYGAFGIKTRDAEAVRRLREKGALLVGKLNMHELGIGVTGLNPHHGSARNPYDLTRCSGGSSSGSAAAVAAGLMPLSLGADGGGSIRIPSAMCGVTGLKPTFGRVSERGAAPLCWSVAHLGPLAWSARDCAVGYAAMAGIDDEEPSTFHQGRVHVDAFENDDLSGLTFGIFRPWFEDADGEVVQACDRMVGVLKEKGAKIRRISIPELDMVRLAHLVTIIGEMTSSQMPIYAEKKSQFALDSRVNMALGRSLLATDYVHAQRHRKAITTRILQLLHDVDGIITPTTGCTALPLQKDALQSGESDLSNVSKIMRYAALANLTGLPAISFPVGYDDGGLPIGMQIMGRPWQESMLLRVAHAAEPFVQRRKPRFFRAPLTGH
ncbi:MAG: amidase [Deltaproteobacteria bacterium]|nr:amidase [Deltaproteobacteria bacterium]